MLCGKSGTNSFPGYPITLLNVGHKSNFGQRSVLSGAVSHDTGHSAVCLYSRTCLQRAPYWPQKCGLSRQVVSGDRFSYTEMYFLLQEGKVGPSAENAWSVKTGGLPW